MIVTYLGAFPIKNAPIPTTTRFSAFFDPSSSANVRVGNTSTSNVATIGDNVGYWIPDGGVFNYINSSGANTVITATNRPLIYNGTTSFPKLVDKNGRIGVELSANGIGLRANLFGVQEIGIPNPTSNNNAMPFSNLLTFGCMVWTPKNQIPVGTIISVNRANDAGTAIISLKFVSSNTINGNIFGHGRFVKNSLRQVSSNTDFSANLAIRKMETENEEVGTWRSLITQIQINSIDLVEDTPIGNTSQRGTGGRMRMWVDGGYTNFIEVPISTYRGNTSIGLTGFMPTKLTVGAEYSADSMIANTATNAIISKLFVTTDTGLQANTQSWFNTLQWLHGI
jgi:hypothetical protein